MATEAERLTISTALAHLTAAVDAIGQIDQSLLEGHEREVLAQGEAHLSTVETWLRARREHASAEMLNNGSAL